MLNRRGFITGLGSVTALGALAACSDSSAPAGGSEGDIENATITFATWNADTAALVEANIASFNAAYPGIEVRITATPWDDYWTKLQTQASSGTAPDVHWMNGPNFQLYASSGQLEPIDDLIADGSIDPSQFPAPLVQLYTLDDSVYGMPGEWGSTGLWYNTKLFEDAGEDLPTANWTWDDVREVSLRIRSKLKSQDIYGILPNVEAEAGYYNWIRQAGGYVISDDFRTSGYDQPEAIAGLQFGVDLLESGASPDYRQIVELGDTNLFANGQAAMAYASANMVAAFGESPDAANFQIAPMPHGPESNISVVHGVAPVVSAGSKNKAAAKAFATWLSGPDYMLPLAERASTIPGLATATEPYLAGHPEWDLQVFLDAGQTGYPYPVSKNTQAWASKESEIVAQLYAGEITAEAAGKNIAEEMNRALEQE